MVIPVITLDPSGVIYSLNHTLTMLGNPEMNQTFPLIMRVYLSSFTDHGFTKSEELCLGTLVPIYVPWIRTTILSRTVPFLKGTQLDYNESAKASALATFLSVIVRRIRSNFPAYSFLAV